jgi:lipoate-protein ligase A
VQGKKIVGSAQKRDKDALLQHGYIPLTMDYDLYAGGANFSAAVLQRSMTTWSDISASGAMELKKALVCSFRDFAGCDLATMNFSPADRERIAVIGKKYASDAWNLSL